MISSLSNNVKFDQFRGSPIWAQEQQNKWPWILQPPFPENICFRQASLVSSLVLNLRKVISPKAQFSSRLVGLAPLSTGVRVNQFFQKSSHTVSRGYYTYIIIYSLHAVIYMHASFIDKFIFACFINKSRSKLATNGVFADLIIMTAWGVE